MNIKSQVMIQNAQLNIKVLKKMRLTVDQLEGEIFGFQNLKTLK
jgi:uncharacterized membrane protein YcaP (DUF421 family)